MDQAYLDEIVEQRLNDPGVLGRLACPLRRNELVAQRHHDSKSLRVFWRNRGDHWRCTVFMDEVSELCLIQVDIHDDGSVRVESWEPCSVTVSPDDDLLCLTRLAAK